MKSKQAAQNETGGQQQDGYRYYAFISYSHKDEKWARWLQRAIEHYRLPNIIRKSRSEQEDPLPRWIRPIFRDKSDLTPRGGLRVSLQRELEDSKYLVLLCSPASAQPNASGEHWVNNEILEFQRMGRGNHIVPLIVQGTPNAADPQQECYPPALRQQADIPLGISIFDTGKKDALLRIISVLIGLNYDDLKRRHQARMRRNRLLVLATALTFALCSGWLYDANYREKTAYYADYVERWGVPEGIGELTAGQIAGRHHYRIIKKGGRVIRLVHANSAGRPVSIENGREGRPIAAQYDNHDANGLPKEMSYQNAVGKTVALIRYTPDRKAIDLTFSSEDSSAPMTVSSRILSSDQSDRRSSISRFLLSYDDNGFVTSRRFARDNWNTPASDVNGVFGHQYQLDSVGRMEKLTYLDNKGQPMEIRRGIAGQQYVYDGKGNLARIIQVSLDGEPVLHKEGYAAEEMDYDKRGNEVLRTYLGVDGEPTLIKAGYASEKKGYDARGNEISRTFLGVDGKPMLIMAGYAARAMNYDKQENEVLRTYLDVDGKPTLLEDGYAGVKKDYDERGNEVLRTFLGVDGKPVLHKKDYAAVKRDYDEQGNEALRTFLGVDGKPRVQEEGYAATKMDYDGRGNEILWTCLGVDSKPRLNKDGYAAVKRVYDERGNEVSWTYLGVDGSPKLQKEGYATVKKDYDERGNVIARTFLGVDGSPALHEIGYAAAKMDYDERGNEVSRTYLGVDGKPRLLKGGYATVKKDYDEWGNEVSRTFFGVNGKPVLHNKGYAAVQKDYDKRGNEVLRTYLGVDGKPRLQAEGFAAIKRDYDAQGNVVSQTFLDVNGNPVQWRNQSRSAQRTRRNFQDLDNLQAIPE